jgi:hypothetical protein
MKLLIRQFSRTSYYFTSRLPKSYFVLNSVTVVLLFIFILNIICQKHNYLLIYWNQLLEIMAFLFSCI